MQLDILHLQPLDLFDAWTGIQHQESDRFVPDQAQVGLGFPGALALRSLEPGGLKGGLEAGALGIVQAPRFLGLHDRQPQPQGRIVLDNLAAGQELAEGPQAGGIAQHRAGRELRVVWSQARKSWSVLRFRRKGSARSASRVSSSPKVPCHQRRNIEISWE